MGSKYVGLDVHQATTSYCVREDSGRVVGQGVFATSEQNVVSFLKGVSGETHVTFEECSLSEWLYEVMHPHCAELVVCNAREVHTKKQPKSDRIDAERLSDLLRLRGLLPVFHGKGKLRALREAVRCHRDLVRDSTRQKNRVKMMFQSRGIDCPGDGVYNSEKRHDYLAKLKDKSARLRVEHYYRVLDEIVACRMESERELIRQGRHHKSYELLKTIPGLGRLNSAKVLGWVVTPYRFRNKRRFAKYCGLAVVQRSSSDWKIGGSGFYRDTKTTVRGLNRDCHRELKTIFKTAAKAAVKNYREWQQYANERLERGMDPGIVRVSIARKLSAICLSVWKKGEPYSGLEQVR